MATGKRVPKQSAARPNRKKASGQPPAADRNAELLLRAGQADDMRFEATLGPTPYSQAMSMAADMDLDRLPDKDGQMRVLLTPDDARRLLAMGVPVHLDQAHPVRPLPPERVMTDEQASHWLDERLPGLPKQGGR